MLRGDPGPASSARGHESPSSAASPSKETRGSYYDHGYGAQVSSNTDTTANADRRDSRFPEDRAGQFAAYDDGRFSPLQEYHSGYTGAGQPRAPSFSSHLRHQSFPNLLPAVLRSRSTSPVRREEPRPLSEDMSFTGDSRRRPGRGSEAVKGGGLAGWFNGTPTGSPSREDRGTPSSRPPSSTSRNISPDGTPTRQGKSATPAANHESITPTPTSAKSRFSFLASSMSATLSRLTTQSPASPTPGPGGADDHDPLYDLHVEAALFPSGPPTERDTFSPAAFKNLQANATGLLTRMQAAYRERTAAMHDLQADRDAQREELEEATTRAQHLKMQLEGMARKAAEQELATRALVAELAAERRRSAAAGAEGSLVSEDLGAEEEDGRRRRGWRRSDGSLDTAATTTDEDSMVEDESVFSRSRSPTSAAGGSVYGGESAGAAAAAHPRVAALGNKQPLGQPQPALNALQKLVKNVTGSGSGSGSEEGGGGDGVCRNCRGRDASVAWDTVSLLRDENKHLKQRVGQLENAVEGALDLANGVGLEY